jgi:hypothetical protein
VLVLLPEDFISLAGRKNAIRLAEHCYTASGPLPRKDERRVLAEQSCSKHLVILTLEKSLIA